MGLESKLDYVLRSYIFVNISTKNLWTFRIIIQFAILDENPLFYIKSSNQGI
jgi:hypothetical protein